MDMFDATAIEDWLLRELSLVIEIKKHCEKLYKKKPSDSGRLQMYNMDIFKDYINLQLQKIQKIKSEL